MGEVKTMSEPLLLEPPSTPPLPTMLKSVILGSESTVSLRSQVLETEEP